VDVKCLFVASTLVALTLFLAGPHHKCRLEEGGTGRTTERALW
jgi:hypothetical protein